MEKYIIPQIYKYSNIDGLIKNNKRSDFLYDNKEDLSITELLQENFVCIVGEPGIGKSRLVDEIKKYILEDIKTYKASEFMLDSVPKDIMYCIIDALDEVEGNIFYQKLQLIKQFKDENPQVKVLFTCRKHYVESNSFHFALCNGLTFVELCRLADNDVMEVLDKCSKMTKDKVCNTIKLKELLAVPRFLTFFWEYVNQKGENTNIGDLFEYIISSSIYNAVEAYPESLKKDNIIILIQRTLEKVAFVMEISRKDQISKDELFTVIDEIRGNMTQMLIANFDLLYFESRILKDTNGILQFENTELQEYLAAKELCRQDNIESVLYDVAVQKDLQHIYPNWFDVIPHISYIEERIFRFINIIKLIVSYESNLENESFESLMRYVDPSKIIPSQREELFSLLLDHYLRVPAYIKWKSSILNLMKDCYTSSCKKYLKPSVNLLNKIQLANINAILEVIVKNNKLDIDVSNYWINRAKELFSTDNEEKQLAALNLYYTLKDEKELIHLSRSCDILSTKVKNRYYEVSGYRRITDKEVIDHWLIGCYENVPSAINAVLCVEDLPTINYAYNTIIKADKLREFFEPKGALSVFYEMYLYKQFNIAWDGEQDSRLLMTRVIASFLINYSYITINEDIFVIIRKILLEDNTRFEFIRCFNENEWHLENILCRIDAQFVDAELISSIDIVLQKTKTEKWLLDIILSTLTYKIRNDEEKSHSLSEYLSRYNETFSQWDRNSLEKANKKNIDPSIIEAFQSLSDPNASKYAKYESVFMLCKYIDVIKSQESQPIVDVILTFFSELDLDNLAINKKGNNSFSMSKTLAIIPYYVKLLYHLGKKYLLEKYKDVLAKTLPIVCCTTNIDKKEIRYIYKSVIGSLSEEEKIVLLKWWEARKDDFMNISSEDVFACITDYGIDALSYKLEEYINEYISYHDISHKRDASRALELISEGFLMWDCQKYKKLFETLTEDSIDSIKMQCNAILINKYKDNDAIKWRFEYLKKLDVALPQNDTGLARAISLVEEEVISSNPQLFRCFMNIKGNGELTEQMYELFDYALSKCVEPDKQEYSSYLIKQICQYFVNSNDVYSIIKMRKKVEQFNKNNVSFLANNVLKNAEIMYLQNEKQSIEKSIRKYNKCIEETHLEIRNDGDLRRYFSLIHYEVQKEIQDQGIYALVRQELLSEDFIQRELKNTIINKCCQMGLEAINIDREVALQDNKRTDLLIRYGLCNPIMVELKLLHNNEIQNKKQRQEYQKKFIQYTSATNACLSVFWVFNIHNEGSDVKKYEDLKNEYKELDNTLVLLTDCRCSSGIETGMPQKSNSLGNKTKIAKKDNRKK